MNFPKLNTTVDVKEFLPQIEALIKTQEKEKPIIYDSSDFLKDMVRRWVLGTVVLPGKNKFDHLVEYIYANYDLRQLRNPKKSLKLSTLIAMAYKHKQKI